MFTGAQHIFRNSTTRLAASGLIHVVILGLLVTLGVHRALPTARTHVSRVSLAAPQIRKARPSSPRVEITPALPSARRFSGSVNPPPRPTVVEVALPEASLPVAVVGPTSVAIAVPVALPAAPVIVGKLASATTQEMPVASSATTRAAGFERATQAEPSLQRPSVGRTGFGDASVLAKADPRPATRPSGTTPVEILSKPRPVYTEEARKLHVEGEVLLEVLFTAGGEPRVLRVMQGLGHGLEAAAIESASHIGFRPATRDGGPVDQIATVHILFQLAY